MNDFNEDGALLIKKGKKGFCQVKEGQGNGMMTFWSTLITYVILFVGSMLLAFACVMLGKKLRDNKDAKKKKQGIEEDK